MNREDVKISMKGFLVSPTSEYLEKLEREQRIEDRKNKTGTITNKEIFEFLVDTNIRIEEIYDLLTTLSK